MVFFILFLWNMLCGVWANQAGDPVVAQQNRQKMHVVIKMFFVMGVSWIAEIILFFVNWLVGDHKIYKGIFLFQLINSLQVNIYYMNLFFYYRFSQLKPKCIQEMLHFFDVYKFTAIDLKRGFKASPASFKHTLLTNNNSLAQHRAQQH